MRAERTRVSGRYVKADDDLSRDSKIDDFQLIMMVHNTKDHILYQIGPRPKTIAIYVELPQSIPHILQGLPYFDDWRVAFQDAGCSDKRIADVNGLN